MAATATQELCERLRTIVALLEQGDREQAASEAARLRDLVAVLPAQMPAPEVAEAKRLLERYAVVGEQLRQATVASMTRVGAARRAAAYCRRASRP